MEVYAGFLEHTDHHVGRLVDALDDLGILEDTLVYYIIGDNGASAEGDLHGSFNELINLNGAAALQTTEFMAARIDEFGTPEAYNHYAVGWAHAMDTPYQWTKQVASHWGGTRNGTIVHWPDGIEAQGRGAQPVPPRDRRRADGPRSGRPARAHDRPRRRAEADRGREHALRVRRRRRRRSATRRSTSRCSATAASTTRAGPRSRATRRRGCSPSCRPFADDTWELYDTNTDWSQAHDLAAEMPEKLEELKALFMEEARKYNVLPLDDRRVERFNSDLAGRPTLIKGNSQLLFGGMGRLSENVGDQHQEQVALGHRRGRRCRDGGAEGVIVAQGGAFAGWSLYVKDGRPKYCYNLFGLQRFHVEGDTEIPRGHPSGAHGVRPTTAAASARAARSRSTSTAPRPARAASRAPSRWSSRPTRPATSARTPPRPSATTTRSEGSRFTGTVEWVQIDIADAAEDLDHLISPEERLKIAMTKQ